MFLEKLLSIFILAFLLNWIWENWHSRFYVHYKNGPITQSVLLRAALTDAIFITFIGIFFIKFSYLAERLWISALIGIMVAVFLEIYALKKDRWAYKKSMPIILLIRVGVTPVLQLGFIAYVVFKIII